MCPKIVEYRISNEPLSCKLHLPETTALFITQEEDECNLYVLKFIQ